MRFFWAFVAAAALSIGDAAAKEPPVDSRIVLEHGPVVTGKAAPSFAGWDLEGRQLSSRKLWGSPTKPSSAPVVISFFATWCKPCKEGLPIIQRVAKRHNARVVLVAFQQNASEVAPWLVEQKLALQTLPDPHAAVSKRWGVDGTLPRTFIVDATGVVRTIFEVEGSDFEARLDLTLNAATGPVPDVDVALAK